MLTSIISSLRKIILMVALLNVVKGTPQGGKKFLTDVKSLSPEQILLFYDVVGAHIQGVLLLCEMLSKTTQLNGF